MQPGELEQQITGLAALDEPVRRSLYFYVAHRGQEVSRDEAARAAGISRSLAGFHLDQLADAGLLETSFRRLSGRVGPGAGRPAKLYRRSTRQLEVTLPERRYQLAATILAGAVEDSKSPKTEKALQQAARRIGRRIGAESKARAGVRPGRKRLVEGTVAALAANGYEPERAAGEIRLRNCPFHALVGEHKELVCGMNLALMQGVVEGLHLPGVKPVLAPRPGRCCVTLKLPPAK
jgi:predicted ArsR family transcriptional regulator